MLSASQAETTQFASRRLLPTSRTGLFARDQGTLHRHKRAKPSLPLDSRAKAQLNKTSLLPAELVSTTPLQIFAFMKKYLEFVGESCKGR